MDVRLAAGTVFAGDFRIVSPLAEGGMGTLYLVEQLATGHRRALKLMLPEVAAVPGFRDRFALEAKVGASIKSDHVVQVVGAGIDASTNIPWLAMELLEGEDLRSLVQRAGPLAWPVARRIMKQLGHAVAAAHAEGIVHRDLKPENVFLAKPRTSDGESMVKVLDFGIAKVLADARTKATANVGSPLWMAPEQTESGRAIVPATDVWALGLIAYFLLTGSEFWNAAKGSEATPLMFMRELLMEPIPSASERAREVGRADLLPRGFDMWFARAVNRDVSARFANAGEASAALEALLVGEAPAAAFAMTAAPATAPGMTAPGMTAPGTTAPSATIAAGPFVENPYVQPPFPAPPQMAAPRPSRPPWLLIAGAGGLLGFTALAVLLLFVFAKKPTVTRDDHDNDDDDRPRKVSSASVEPNRIANPNASKVELFVMSKCPYGIQTENAFADVVKKFGPDLDFRVEYIGTVGPSGDLNSLHGPTEVTGDRFQICAQKYAPSKWFDTILCQNKSVKDMDTNWESCANEVGVDPGVIAKVTKCANGTEGTELLTASFQRATSRSVRGSPTIFVNGEEHQGGRKATDLIRSICNHSSGSKPKLCDDIPVAQPVNVTLLSDARCTDCDTKRLRTSVTQRIDNPIIRELDVGSPDGKSLFESIKPTKLPVVVFDETLDKDSGAKSAFGSSAKTVGKFRLVSAGDWNPACADANGCDLAECKEVLSCRPETPKRLDVFVMSHCPYAAKGMDAMHQVLDNFKTHGVKIDFQIHFIGNDDPSKGLTSMHGADEVADDLREVCAIDLAPKDLKFMDFIWCRAKNFKDPSWEQCTGGTTGFDKNAIQTCAEGNRGKDLLTKSFAFSSNMGISASPTWLVNNKFKFSGIDAETVKKNFCNHNKVDGCDVTLDGPPPRPTPPQPAPPRAAPPVPGRPPLRPVP